MQPVPLVPQATKAGIVNGWGSYELQALWGEMVCPAGARTEGPRSAHTPRSCLPQEHLDTKAGPFSSAGGAWLALRRTGTAVLRRARARAAGAGSARSAGASIAGAPNSI